MPNYRKVGIKLITKVTNLSIKEKLTDSQSGFRAYSKKALDKIIPSDEGMGVSTEILIKASNLDLKITEVPIKVSYEGETSTKDPISHGSSVIFSTIKFTSIHNPLKFYGIPGLIFLVIGLGFICMDYSNLFSTSRDYYKCFVNWNWMYCIRCSSINDSCNSFFTGYAHKRYKREIKEFKNN